jgi:hypothetical protein
MEVYVLYESIYGELLQDTGDSTKILGVFNDLQQAIKIAENNVADDLNNNYVLDNGEYNGASANGGFWRLFYGEQENWNSYYEIYIKQYEVK